MVYFILSLTLFSIQSILIATTFTNIWPELIIFPWLTKLGYLPYRDFFDHHGFLLDYLIAPIISDKSLLSLKLLYFVIQNANLYLVLLILKRLTNLFGFVIGGILFVFFSYYFSESNFWYETVLVTLFLLTYFILISRSFHHKAFILSIVAAVASFVKPNAAVLIFPILIVTKNIKIWVLFVISWIAILFYFFLNHGFSQIVSNLFYFNSYLSVHYKVMNFLNRKDYVIFVITIFLILYSYLISAKKMKKQISILMMMFFTGLIFLGVGKSKLHLYPAVVFFPILISIVIEKALPIQRYFISICLCIIFVIIGWEIGRYFLLYRHEFVPWMQTVVSRQADLGIKLVNSKKMPFFVLGDNVELYFLNDIVPPTYFAIKLPLVEDFFPDYQEKVIKSLQEKNIRYVIIPKPEKEVYTHLVNLNTYIKEKYILKLDQPYY